jgi:iron complex outermembrane receptor protein
MRHGTTKAGAQGNAQRLNVVRGSQLLAYALLACAFCRPLLAQDTADTSVPEAAPGPEQTTDAAAESATLPTIPVKLDASAPKEEPVVRQSDAVQLEEVVVTSQKQTSSIQKSAASITAISGRDMEFRKVENIEDLQFQVPGLSVSESSGSSLVSIRGVGLNIDTGATEAAVAVHVNGVYQPRVTTGPLGFADLERVEVLRGPQGTLYGRNATSGVVNYILNRPTSAFEASVKLGAAQYGQRSAVGIVSGPVFPGMLDGRLVAEYNEEDGYVINPDTGKPTDSNSGYGGRLALSLLSFGDLIADLSVLYRYDKDITPREVILAPPDPNMETSLGIFRRPRPIPTTMWSAIRTGAS